MTNDQIKAFELRISGLGAAAPGAKAVVAEVRRLRDQVHGLEKLPDALRDSLDKSDEDRHKLKAENAKLREVIDEGAGCCLCEFDRWGIEITRCQVHTELERLRKIAEMWDRREQETHDAMEAEILELKADNERLCDLIQEVIEHDETTGWGQNKLAAALKPNEPETKTVAVPAGEGYEAPIAGIAKMIHEQKGESE